MDIAHYLSQRKQLIDNALPSYVPRPSKYTRKLHKAVMYSLMSGGKRIRPILALAACDAVGGKMKSALPMAAALEMAHAYTLIHDDLPAMDDDDYRRGKLSCHKKFGEASAILAGDMLNSLAFQVIAQAYGNKADVLIKELSSSIGLNGVIGGQESDLEHSKMKVTRKDLKWISLNKTAKLFMASVKCGAIAGGAGKRVITRLSNYAMHLGLAFQIIDDILDKAKGHKNSWLMLGERGAGKEAEYQLRLALLSLPKAKSYDRLREIAEFLSKRKG